MQTVRPTEDHTDSYYAASTRYKLEFPPLEGDVEADVCVIGGGYTGVSTALHLAEKGYTVTLLEANRLGWGASGRNGGHAGTGQRKEQAELEKSLGHELASSLWDMGLEAVQLLEDLIERHKIDCDLKRGILHLAAKPGDVDYLREGVEFLEKKYNYQGGRFIEQEETRAMVGSDKFYAGMLDEPSLHMHPLNFLLGMADAADKAGVQIFEASRVNDIRKGETAVISTSQGRVKAKYVVLGCNGYLEKLVPKIASEIMPINNFVLATEPLGEALARELIRDDQALQDSLFVINYWKLSADNRLLFGGGENYSPRFPRDLKAFVRKYMLRIYPQLENTRIDYAWGGSLAITMNRMPDFGRVADNIFYAQGFSGHGLPTATFAGKLMSEVVSGTAERFDVMANLPIKKFPGGTLLRYPGMVAGMLYYSLRDKL